MKKIPKIEEKENDSLEEYQFIANCLKIGLRIEDLKQMKYTDVAKIMLCFADTRSQYKKATQKDIDNFLR